MPTKSSLGQNTKNTNKIVTHRHRKPQKLNGLEAIDPPSREKNPSSPPSGPNPLRQPFSPQVRTRKWKKSTSLSVANVSLLKEGVAHSLRIDLPLNRMMTINCTLAGVADAHIIRKKLLKLIYDWVRSQGLETSYVWVMENGTRHGTHFHLLMHVPSRIRKDFNKRMRGWRKSAGLPWKKGVVHSRPIGFSIHAAALRKVDHGSYGANLGRAFQYISKSADIAARRLFGIRFFRQFSHVEGKRCGTSRNLGAKAIRRWHERSEHAFRSFSC